jgi:hypothetical protein
MTKEGKVEHYSAELEYLLPVFQTITVEVPAGTPIEEVCKQLQEAGSEWVGGGTSGYDGSSDTYINALAKGKFHNLYSPEATKAEHVPIPLDQDKAQVLVKELFLQVDTRQALEDLRQALETRIIHIAHEASRGEPDEVAEHARLTKLIERVEQLLK